jgi:hypothetical protein
MPPNGQSGPSEKELSLFRFQVVAVTARLRGERLHPVFRTVAMGL